MSMPPVTLEAVVKPDGTLERSASRSLWPVEMSRKGARGRYDLPRRNYDRTHHG
jgi:hypothetical protein